MQRNMIPSVQVAREVPANIPIQDVPLPLQREVEIARAEDGQSDRNWLWPAAFVLVGAGVALLIYFVA